MFAEALVGGRLVKPQHLDQVIDARQRGDLRHGWLGRRLHHQAQTGPVGAALRASARHRGARRGEGVE